MKTIVALIAISLLFTCAGCSLPTKTEKKVTPGETVTEKSFDRPEQIQQELNLASTSDGIIKATFHEKHLIPVNQIKINNVSETTTCCRDPLLWLLLGVWNPIVWISDGPLAYKMLTGKHSTSTYQDRLTTKIGAEWIDVPVRDGTKIVWYSDIVCASGCTTSTKDGAAILDISKELSNKELNNEYNEITINVAAENEITGGFIKKDITKPLASIFSPADPYNSEDAPPAQVG
ncbi:hypothetical protein [Methylococcus capsulatus]|uniref:hypothetical protein n=1 Tax=Methylococcus capsulatus TaxID=414 RepID=UPI001C5314E7|nr:hypothetical protein [Methylococcus capsulatus]QXP90166.1 hypothetical protein KW114_14085 [Methylococcus capsulatus]